MDNNINFTARMDVTRVLDTQRWKNVSNIFRQTTKEYPNDKFYLTEYTNGIRATGINSRSGDEIEAVFTQEDVTNLLAMPDEKIAEQFKKILDINNVKNKVYSATQKYVKSIEKVLNKDTDSTSMWDNAVGVAQKETKNLQSKDGFLSNISILW